MIVDQPLDGTMEDRTHCVFLGLDNLRELVGKEMRNAADKRQGQIITPKGHNMNTNKVLEVVLNECLDTRVIDMVMNKGSKTGEKTVGQWLAINPIDDLR